jgi:ParB-like chromosome segregation protein Spo0J
MMANDGVTWAVSVTSLRPADSPRLDGVDARHALVLAKSGTAFPPILVHRESMRVIDGMHRLRAAVLSNQQTIEVQFFDGDPNEAFVAAVQANILHGLPLTLADREAAATRIIAAYPERSDGSIAAVTGLAARTIAAIRQRTAANVSHITARIGRDGRVRPLSSADGRRAASHTIAKHPDASLRQIARMTGISPTTVRDVRERMRRGEDPVPAGQRNRHGQRSPSASETEHNGGAGAGQSARRNRASLLETLSRDPSLRFTESGRNLLRWLIERARGPQDAGGIVDGVPPHCAYIVAEVARGCADEWSTFAAQLEQRLRAMD